MLRKIIFWLTLAVTFIPGAASAKPGFYMGLGATYNTIAGDFDGEAGLSNGTEVIILPKIDGAYGVNLLGGYRINDSFSFEFDVMTSKHSGTWQGLRGDVGSSSLNINWKYSFPAAHTTQPYLLVGLNYSWLQINKGSENLFTGKTEDARLLGSGLNLGVGIDKYIGPNTSLTLGLVYRYIEYTYANGVSSSGGIDDGLDGSGLSFMLSTAYHF